MNVVRTVLGDLPASSLGVVDYHEHVFQRSPLLPGDELDDTASSTEELALLAASGVQTIIDATPIGLGRRPEALPEASRRSGVAIVAATGAHRREHYGADHWILDQSVQQLQDRFLEEIVTGFRVGDDLGSPRASRPARAGIVKTGVGYWRVPAFERRVLAAAAAAHRAASVPIMVHLEHGSAAHEVLDLLVGEGADLTAVVLAHIDRNPDPLLHAELASRGAYLGYDGFARTRLRPDSELLACLITAAEAGAHERLLVGGDVARRTRYLAYGGMPGLAYLGRRVIPRLRSLDPSLAELVTIHNPARLLGRFPPDTAA